jgi:hypothetical protein
VPETPWGPYASPLLSGSFGVLQSEAAARAGTADVWRALRLNAATWQWQTQGGGPLPSQAELEAIGRQILHDQGVTIQHVNAYRQIAGEWRAAKENLQRLAADQQIMASEVWQPPWAKTTGAGTPARYQVRVQWQITLPTGELQVMRGTYEVDSPLTTLNDVIDQARGLAGKKPTSDMPLGSKITDVIDYEIAQI